jgi:hypothetical protein
MASCIFCGKSAGPLRQEHRECRAAHETGGRQIVEGIADAAFGVQSLDSLLQQITSIASASYISDAYLHALKAQGWAVAVDRFLEDHLLSPDDEKRLARLQERLLLTREELERAGYISKVIKSAVLSDLVNGVIPKRFQVEGNLPINLHKDEQVVWAFDSVKLYEERTRTRYVGIPAALSVEVMNGVYYTLGNFRGIPVPARATTPIAVGLFVVTSKHLYFSARQASFRVAYKEIVQFEPLPDGIRFVRDAADANPQIVETGDGWFIYNLVAALTRLQ